MDVLGIQWHLADEETRKLEPVVSNVVLASMRAAVGDDPRCPHGNPIPGFEPVDRVDLRSLVDVGMAALGAQNVGGYENLVGDLIADTIGCVTITFWIRFRGVSEG